MPRAKRNAAQTRTVAAGHASVATVANEVGALASPISTAAVRSATRLVIAGVDRRG